MSRSTVIIRTASAPALRWDVSAAEVDRSGAWMVGDATTRFVDAQEAPVAAIGKADGAAACVVSRIEVERASRVEREEHHAA